MKSHRWNHDQSRPFQVSNGHLSFPVSPGYGNKIADTLETFKITDEGLEALRDAIDDYLNNARIREQLDAWQRERWPEISHEHDERACAQLTQEREAKEKELRGRAQGKAHRSIDDA